MKHRITIALVSSLFVSCSMAIAVEPPVRDEPVSVYQINPWIDGGIVAGSAAGTIFAFSNPGIFIHKNCPCDPGSVNSFDRSAIYNNRPGVFTLATDTVYATILAPVVLDALTLGFSKALAEDVVVFSEALAVQQALTTLLKFSIQRPFPHRYSPENTYAVAPGDFIAFPSGHTATVAALLATSAMTVNLRYGSNYVSWGLAAILTAAVGFEMVSSGEHFPTDVFAGAALGAVVGIGVPLIHVRRDEETGSHLGLLSTPSGMGVAYNVRF